MRDFAETSLNSKSEKLNTKPRRYEIINGVNKHECSCLPTGRQNPNDQEIVNQKIRISVGRISKYQGIKL